MSDLNQLYATIRPGTKYDGQGKGGAFPVKFVPDIEGYHFRGGPGGRYRHSDLLFYRKGKDNKAQPICTFHYEEPEQIIKFTLANYKTLAAKGDLNPNWFTPYIQDLISQLKQIEALAHETAPEEEDDYV